MDHERTEKELEEIFEEIQRSYKTFANDALTLQERTLEFARELLEKVADQETEGIRATLEGLADRSRGERERGPSTMVGEDDVRPPVPPNVVPGARTAPGYG